MDQAPAQVIQANKVLKDMDGDDYEYNGPVDSNGVATGQGHGRWPNGDTFRG